MVENKNLVNAKLTCSLNTKTYVIIYDNRKAKVFLTATFLKWSLQCAKQNAIFSKHSTLHHPPHTHTHTRHTCHFNNILNTTNDELTLIYCCLQPVDHLSRINKYCEFGNQCYCSKSQPELMIPGWLSYLKSKLIKNFSKVKYFHSVSNLTKSSIICRPPYQLITDRSRCTNIFSRYL